jgi:hypothetical protein
MKTFHIFCILLAAMIASCDLRSGIAKEGMEKYISTPTPPFSPTPTPVPIDPADIVAVDVNQDGEKISIDGYDQKVAKDCTKFNRLIVSGDGNQVTVKGACRQIMINGDRNEVTADAVGESVFNGTGNVVRYSRYANGKQPTVIDNQPGNIIEKVSPTLGQKPVKPRPAPATN